MLNLKIPICSSLISIAAMWRVVAVSYHIRNTHIAVPAVCILTMH